MKPSTKAMKIARRINLAKTYKDKAKLVHQWTAAVKEMLKGSI